MSPTAVMFDLDGTLADTLADLTDAANDMRAAFGREPLGPEVYRTLVGHGAPSLVRRTLELSENDPRVAAAVERFRAHLIAHEHAQTRPYPGVPELLDALVARGACLAVLSNKPHEPTVEVVARVFADWPFVEVRGHRDDAPPKPDPAAALEIAHGAGIPPRDWLYVGDSAVDMHTARNAGMTSVGVTWGFRSVEELREAGAQHLIDEPMELLPLVGVGG